MIEKVLDAARWAPSGVNTQPWQVAVATGEVKRKIGDEIIDARVAGQSPDPDYQYYPEQFTEPYRSRRKTCGLALYGALGIQKEDTERRLEQWNRNYHGFGAPDRVSVTSGVERWEYRRSVVHGRRSSVYVYIHRGRVIRMLP